MMLTKDGNPAKVAFLVYNDAQNDSRVQKESNVVNSRGGQARIFAVSRLMAGREPGFLSINGIDVERLKEFQLIDFMPDALVNKLREARDHRQASLSVTKSVEAEDAAKTSSLPQIPAAEQAAPRAHPVSLRKPIHLVRRGAIELMRRAYGPVKLSNWWMKLVAALYEYRPDVIHANDANTLLPGYLLSKMLDVPLVYDSHELWRHRNVRQDRWLAPHVERFIETVAIKRANAVITVSPSIARWLQEEYNLSSTPVLVRNIPKDTGGEANGLLRALAGLSAEDRILSYSGGITTARGLEEAIDALALLDESVHFVMLGYGEQAFVNSLFQRARDKNVEDRIHVVGPVGPDEVAGALADADVALVAIQPKVLSYRFALPNKLFEAIHGRVPIVASNLPDMAEILRKYEAGELFEFGDPTELAVAIESVINNHNSYASGVAAAADDFSWDHEADALATVYQEALNGK